MERRIKQASNLSESLLSGHWYLQISTLAVIGAGASFSSTLLWQHLRQLWLVSADFWQSLWERFLEHFGDDEYKLFVYGTTIWTMSFYWIVGLVFTALDVFNWPLWLRKYKVQPGTNEPVEMKRLLSVTGRVLFNQIFVGIPFAVVAYYLQHNPGEFVHPQLPHFHRVLFEFLVFLFLEETTFYYTHRLLHHKLFYKRIHKKHHEWTSPIALMSVYCHPLEHALSNIAPVALGPIIMSSHLSVSWLWYGRATLRTFFHHCGYHFPGFPSPEAHDFHHLNFNECFGLLGIMDYLYGSDKLFRSSPSYKRHVISFSTESLRNLIPDDNKQYVKDISDSIR